MRPPVIIPILEFKTETFEMSTVSDKPNLEKPFVLERAVHSLGNGNATMLADCAEALFDAPFFEKIIHARTGKVGLLIGDDVLGRSVFSESLFESVDGPCGVGAVEGRDSDDLSGEVIDGNEDIALTIEPAIKDGEVGRPDVIGIESLDGR